MGASFSTANNIFVQTERPVYYSGDTVAGNIYLNVIQSFRCDGVHLLITGEEHTKWVDVESYTVREGEQDVTRTRDIPRHGKNVFFEIRVEVYNFGGQVMPGQYAFPFVFVLPRGLPGVFNAQSSNRSEAHIEYRLRSECVVGGMFNPNLHYTQFLTVNELLDVAVSEVVHEKSIKVNCCCCFSRGDAHLRTRMDKSAYMAGETAQIVCDITNHSSEEFAMVRVKLERSLLLKDGHGHQHWSKDIVSENDYPGIGAQTERVGGNALYVPLGLSPQIYPSTRGRLVECTYAVDVQFVAKGCCITNLDVTTPVRIYAPPPSTFVVQAPMGWAPQVMHAVNVSLPLPVAGLLPPPPGVVFDQPGAMPPPTYQQGPYPPPASERSALLRSG